MTTNGREISINQGDFVSLSFVNFLFYLILCSFFSHSVQALFSSSFYRSGEIRLRFFIPPLYATNALFRTIPKCNEQNVMHYKIRCHSSRVLAQSRTRIKFQACFPYTFVVAGAGWFGFVRARELVQIFICLYFIKSSFRNECEHSKNVTASNGNKKKRAKK